MTALAEAMQRAGIGTRNRPDEPKATSEPWLKIGHQNRILAMMTDEDLEQAIEQASVEIARITTQLKTSERTGGRYDQGGEVWRQNAGKARSHRKDRIDAIRDEQARRTAERERDPDLYRVRQELAIRAAEAEEAAAGMRYAEIKAQSNAKRFAFKAEADLIWQKAQARRARMFMMAAYRSLHPEDYGTIIGYAKEMFPDAPEWRCGDANPSADPVEDSVTALLG